MIRLAGLEIEGERIADGQWLPVDRVTALIGRNDAGKSTILRALGKGFARENGAIGISAEAAGLRRIDVELDDDTFEALINRTCELVHQRRSFDAAIGNRPVILDLARPQAAEALGHADLESDAPDHPGLARAGRPARPSAHDLRLSCSVGPG